MDVCDKKARRQDSNLLIRPKGRLCSEITSLPGFIKNTLDNILDERLLELCWEGWRRPDLIRFNRYKSLYEGPGAIDESDGHTNVFPLPADVRALNSNLTQNPGY